MATSDSRRNTESSFSFLIVTTDKDAKQGIFGDVAKKIVPIPSLTPRTHVLFVMLRPSGNDTVEQQRSYTLLTKIESFCLYTDPIQVSRQLLGDVGFSSRRKADHNDDIRTRHLVAYIMHGSFVWRCVRP